MAAVGSVVNAIAIMRHLVASHPQGVNAIARAVSISPSTCFNILKTLVNEDFVEFEPVAKVYSIGAAPAKLFSGEVPLLAWRQTALNSLKSLASEFSLTCGLWRVTSGRTVLTSAVEGLHSTRISLAEGQRLPEHLGAMGRCIVAVQGLSTAEVADRIAKLRWADRPSIDDFMADVDAVRTRGWAIDDGNYLRGVTTIAASVKSLHGDVRACMTATMFSRQHDEETLTRIGDELAGLAQTAEKRLGRALDRAA